MLQGIAPSEKFATSLGVDPSLRVSYHSSNKRRRTAPSSFSGLLSRQKEAQITSEGKHITIKNTRAVRAWPVIVRDTVPVSVDAELKVIVDNPKELADIKETKVVEVGPGLKARWAANRDKEESEGPAVEAFGTDYAEEGTVEWSCDIAPGKSVDLHLRWDVVALAGQDWRSL